MRISLSFPVANPQEFKDQLFAYSSQFAPVAYYDSNEKAERFDAIAAWGIESEIESNDTASWEQLQDHRDAHQDWLFGYLSYDLKNELEALESAAAVGVFWPNLYFFQPKKIVLLHNNQATFLYCPSVADDIEADRLAISTITRLPKSYDSKIEWRPRISKATYFEQFNTIQQHLSRGDIYEVNFCQLFEAKNVTFDPRIAYSALNTTAKAPFSGYFVWNDHHLLCASPERYLRKTGTELLSQPIKGTIGRGATPAEDDQLLATLQANPKERSENIMIVDLVRNDLSRTAVKNSVKVTELCAGYRFNNVQHLISSITSTTDKELPVIKSLTTTFPMGSMTGAPKIRAMEIASKVEGFKRGIYSGALGYFTPENDFDFNVVIRSLQFNATENCLAYAVGSAITAAAEPEQEYQECLLKAINILRALES